MPPSEAPISCTQSGAPVHRPESPVTISPVMPQSGGIDCHLGDILSCVQYNHKSIEIQDGTVKRVLCGDVLPTHTKSAASPVFGKLGLLDSRAIKACIESGGDTITSQGGPFMWASGQPDGVLYGAYLPKFAGFPDCLIVTQLGTDNTLELVYASLGITTKLLIHAMLRTMKDFALKMFVTCIGGEQNLRIKRLGPSHTAQDTRTDNHDVCVYSFEQSDATTAHIQREFWIRSAEIECLGCKVKFTAGKFDEYCRIEHNGYGMFWGQNGDKLWACIGSETTPAPQEGEAYMSINLAGENQGICQRCARSQCVLNGCRDESNEGAGSDQCTKFVAGAITDAAVYEEHLQAYMNVLSKKHQFETEYQQAEQESTTNLASLKLLHQEGGVEYTQIKSDEEGSKLILLEITKEKEQHDKT